MNEDVDNFDPLIPRAVKSLDQPVTSKFPSSLQKSFPQSFRQEAFHVKSIPIDCNEDSPLLVNVPDIACQDDREFVTDVRFLESQILNPNFLRARDSVAQYQASILIPSVVKSLDRPVFPQRLQKSFHQSFRQEAFQARSIPVDCNDDNSSLLASVPDNSCRDDTESVTDVSFLQSRILNPNFLRARDSVPEVRAPTLKDIRLPNFHKSIDDPYLRNHVLEVEISSQMRTAVKSPTNSETSQIHNNTNDLPTTYKKAFNKFHENFPSDLSVDERRLKFSDRKPPTPLRRRETCSGFFPAFSSSVESETYDPSASSIFRNSSSVETPLKDLELSSNHDYLNRNRSLEERKLKKAHSLVADDQVIDVEYDSDIGWKTTNVRRNPFRKEKECKLEAELEASGKQRSRTYSRDSLKLDLKMEKYQKRALPSVEKKTKASMSSIVDGFKSKISISPEQSATSLKAQLTPDNTNEPKISEVSANERSTRKNAFVKCRSRSSEHSQESSGNKSDNDEMEDDVFETNSKTKKAPAKPKTKVHRSKAPGILEAAKILVESKTSTNVTPTKSSKNASSNAIANSPYGSLKKSSDMTNSDYDRDRGRSRHMESGHRESFKKNARTNEQDRDASDREQKDGSLNRSLSNTDTNLEDRIGKRTSSLLNPALTYR